MTHKQYGQWLATIFSSLPGGMGVWGILVGLHQRRVGPVIVGLVFLFIAVVVCRAIIRVANQRKD